MILSIACLALFFVLVWALVELSKADHGPDFDKQLKGRKGPHEQ